MKTIGRLYLRLPEGFRRKLRIARLLRLRMIVEHYSFPPADKIKVPRLHRRFSRPSFSQQGEDLVLLRVLEAFDSTRVPIPGFYVDVGAYHPIIGSVTNALHLRGWQGVSFDASETSELLFRALRREQPFVRGVVGKDDGIVVPFYFGSEESDFSQISSKFPREDESRPPVYLAQVNLNSQLLALDIERIDVLCLDIEGAEFEVISTFDFKRWNPAIVVVEIHATNLLEVLETETAKILRNQGYHLVASCVITHFFAKPASA